MIKKIVLIAILSAILGGGGYAAYLFFMPHRDTQATEADMVIDAKELVNRFLTDSKAANQEFLSNDGDSKILIINGRIESIITDGLGQKVVLLKNTNDLMGVSCTLTKETESTLTNIEIGSLVKIKGVIRSGAEYDEDLDLAEDVIMEKCAII